MTSFSLFQATLTPPLVIITTELCCLLMMFVPVMPSPSFSYSNNILFSNKVTKFREKAAHSLGKRLTFLCNLSICIVGSHFGFEGRSLVLIERKVKSMQ